MLPTHIRIKYFLGTLQFYKFISSFFYNLTLTFGVTFLKTDRSNFSRYVVVSSVLSICNLQTRYVYVPMLSTFYSVFYLVLVIFLILYPQSTSPPSYSLICSVCCKFHLHKAQSVSILWLQAFHHQVSIPGSILKHYYLPGGSKICTTLVFIMNLWYLFLDTTTVSFFINFISCLFLFLHSDTVRA